MSPISPARLVGVLVSVAVGIAAARGAVDGPRAAVATGGANDGASVVFDGRLDPARRDDVAGEAAQAVPTDRADRARPGAQDGAVAPRGDAPSGR